MNKWYKLIIATVMALGLMTGCEQPTPEQLVASSSDKAMMKAFSNPAILEKSEYLITYGPADLIKTKLSIGSAHPNLGAAIGNYTSRYNSSTDKKAQAFIRVAKARGNSVKLYKSSINQQIASRYAHSSSKSTSAVRFDLDPALIEFNKGGRIVSILIRRHYFNPLTHGVVTHDRETMVILGNSAKKVEMSIGNNSLDNGYITTL